MITDARHLGDSIAALNWDSMFKPVHSATPASMPMADIAILRAARNVAEWRTYLPEDCVAAMINDGWHWTT
jgi:hypothetical protein